jgi:NAD kinase
MIDLKVVRKDEVVLSFDGQVELAVPDGQEVRVKLSPHVARFLRMHEPTYFYRSLWQKLREGGHAGRYQS